MNLNSESHGFASFQVLRAWTANHLGDSLQSAGISVTGCGAASRTACEARDEAVESHDREAIRDDRTASETAWPRAGDDRSLTAPCAGSEPIVPLRNSNGGAARPAAVSTPCHPRPLAEPRVPSTSSRGFAKWRADTCSIHPRLQRRWASAMALPPETPRVFFVLSRPVGEMDAMIGRRPYARLSAP